MNFLLKFSFLCSIQVNEAAQILHDYNTRLSVEMEERKKLTQMLKDFQAEQKELLAQAEQRLEVWTILFYYFIYHHQALVIN